MVEALKSCLEGLSYTSPIGVRVISIREEIVGLDRPNNVVILSVSVKIYINLVQCTSSIFFFLSYL